LTGNIEIGYKKEDSSKIKQIIIVNDYRTTKIQELMPITI
jgi:hypothetical protein